MAHSKHIALATALLCGASAPAACTACSSGGGATAAGARDAGSPVGGDAGDATAPVRDAGAPDVFAADASTDAAVLLADAGILSDPSVWTPTPIGSTCSLYTANVPPDPFPPRVWQACGAGCQVSASALPIAGIPGSSSLSSLGHSGGTCVNGDIFLLIDMGFAPSVGTVDVVEQLFRLSDGTTFSAAELRGVSANCGVSATVVDAPGALSLSTGTSVLLGRSSLAAPGSIAWQKSWLPEPSIELFRFADTDGIGLTYYDDAVRIVGSQDAGAWTVVSSNGHSVEDTSSHGGLVVWCEWSGSGGTVQGYASASGAATYVSQPGYWQSVARVSDERLTWISVNGPNVTSGAYTSAQFFWSPVPTAPSDVVVTSGPTIPATSVLSDLAVGGDYAAVTGCAGTAASCKVYVLQFSTQKMWALGPRPGGNNAFAAVLAAGPNEIVLAETDATSNGHQGTFTRIVRVATSALDGLGW